MEFYFSHIFAKIWWTQRHLQRSYLRFDFTKYYLFGGSEFLVFIHCDPHAYLVNSTDTREKSFQYTKLSQSVSNCKLGGLKKTYILTSKIDPVKKLREIKNVSTLVLWEVIKKYFFKWKQQSTFSHFKLGNPQRGTFRIFPPLRFLRKINYWNSRSSKDYHFAVSKTLNFICGKFQPSKMAIFITSGTPKIDFT